MLQDAIRRWRDWQQKSEKLRLRIRRLVIKRLMGLAIRQWKVFVVQEKIAADRDLRRREMLACVLRSALLRKSLWKLTRNARSGRILQHLRDSWHKRLLNDGFHVWKNQQQLLQPKGHARAIDPPDRGALPCSVRVTTKAGKPLKEHCRCVYTVGRCQRCMCHPRIHLLRRVEELHRLVTKGLDRRDGGCRLLSTAIRSGAVMAASASDKGTIANDSQAEGHSRLARKAAWSNMNPRVCTPRKDEDNLRRQITPNLAVPR